MSGPKKTSDGRWKVDERPFGKEGKRFIRLFDNKADANVFLKWVLAQAHGNKDWAPARHDKRLLSELIGEWHDLHGHTLKGGDKRKTYLLALANVMGNPRACDFTAASFLQFRKSRLEGTATAKKNKKTPISKKTCNHDLGYFKAVFNVLIRADKWQQENPLAKIKPIALDDNEMAYLDFKQLDKLLFNLGQSKSADVLMISRICLSTGCRWGEAESLAGRQIRNCRITFLKTKTSRSRTVPISEELKTEIFKGRSRTGKLFTGCYKSFGRALERSNIILPKGQATHVLRHTFASHFMMADGNLVTLSKILGHSTIQMTMRYAHLAPKYLIAATEKNPLAQLEQLKMDDKKAG
ncbi:phage integrase [Dasania marina]|uniref:phage integrase n=1 Tax=Dasania marina TaxID=471499 RepID=UPI000378AB77|nr:tyrosine-type recombinase/integrase [Dasania marina]